MKKTICDESTSQLQITFKELADWISTTSVDKTKRGDWDKAEKLFKGISNDEKITFKGHSFFGPMRSTGYLLDMVVEIICQINNTDQFSLPDSTKILMGIDTVLVTSSQAMINKIKENMPKFQSPERLSGKSVA